MASKSLLHWQKMRQDELDQLEDAHATLGGSAPGRRYAMQQINYAYTVLLSSHFQGYCRDLHSECVDHIVRATPINLQNFLRVEFLRNRTLDKGNPRSGNIGSDFNRLGISFWSQVKKLQKRNGKRKDLLDELVDWRNAIGHQDFSGVGGQSRLHLSKVRRWRSAVNGLASNFDKVMHDYLTIILQANPW